MAIVGALPFNLTNGTVGDATQVMAIVNFIASQVNTNALPIGTPSKGALLGPPKLIVVTTVYNPLPVPSSILALQIGPGGAGGGAVATAAGQNSIGGGGGGGAVTLDYYSAGFVGQTITIGNAGLGVAGADGGDGSDSSFMGVIAGGGPGGGKFNAAAPVTVGPGVSGGTPSGSSLYFAKGGSGGEAWYLNIAQVIGGRGGSSGLGGGSLTFGGFTSAGGVTNTTFGGGGTGAANAQSQAATRAGGSGGPACTLIIELA